MSQLESQVRTIEGHKFEVFKLSPLDANDVLIDIGHALAPALGEAAKIYGAMSEEEGNPLDLDTDDPRIGSAIAALAQNITKPKMRELINTMASVTHCDGTPLPRVMEKVFRGDLPLLYQWLWFSLTANFSNFSGWLAKSIGGATARAKASQSQNTSSDTGRS